MFNWISRTTAPRKTRTAGPTGPVDRDDRFSRLWQETINRGVAAGPDCACGHARIEHVGVGFFDGMCQVEGCACTPSGYAFPDGATYRPPDADLLGMP